MNRRNPASSPKRLNRRIGIVLGLTLALLCLSTLLVRLHLPYGAFSEVIAAILLRHDEKRLADGMQASSNDQIVGAPRTGLAGSDAAFAQQGNQRASIQATTQCYRPPDFYLRFPLQGKTPYNNGINSVFDHVNPSTDTKGPNYHPDNPQHIIVFTGEEGKAEYGKTSPPDCYVGGGCGLKNLGRTPFIVNGNYHIGQTDAVNVYYDGHDGYDFKAGSVDVFPAADGNLMFTNNSTNSHH